MLLMHIKYNTKIHVSLNKHAPTSKICLRRLVAGEQLQKSSLKN